MDTVIFDMDGLLIDSEPLWREGMANVFTQLGAHLQPQDYKKTMGLRTSEVVDYWCEYFGWTTVAPEKITEDILDEVINLVVQKGELMEGVQYILDFFREKHFKIGLASSSPMVMIEKFLQHFQLRSYFEACHSGEFQEYGKPHPGVYLDCAKELNEKPVNCLVFEDSLNGLIAAKAAQMKTIVIPEDEDKGSPQFSIADVQLRSLKEFSDQTLNSLL